MLDSLVSILESVAMRALLTEEAIEPTGSHHAISAPFGTFATGDAPIAIGVANDPLFVRFATVLGHPEWADDPRFADDARRGRNRHALQAVIEERLAELTREEALTLLGGAGVPCGPVLGVREMFDHPQVAARGLIREEPDGFRSLANAFRLRGCPDVDRPAPALGEHNHLIDDLLREPERTGARP